MQILLNYFAALPARLNDAGNHPGRSKFSKTDSTELELSQVSPAAPAAPAPVVLSHFELEFPLCLQYFRFFRQAIPPFIFS